MTVFMSLILILQRLIEMGLPPSLKAHYLLKRTRISIWHIFIGLWNGYVAICIKIYNFKGSKKYDRFYVIDFNFVICIKTFNFKGSKNMTVFMSLILI